MDFSQIIVVALFVILGTIVYYLLPPSKQKPNRVKPRESVYQERWKREIGRSFDVLVELRTRNVRETVEARDEQEARMNTLDKYPQALRMWLQEIE